MLKKILSVAVNALCVVAIALSLVAAAVLFTTPRGEAPSLLGHSFMTVLTGSMEPTLTEGSLIVVRKTAPEEIAVGDVISYYTTIAGYEGLINTHRVTAIESEEDGSLLFHTKGDANAVEDPSPVAANQLIGRMVASSGGIGFLISALHKPYVFLPVVIIPLVILIISCVRHIMRLAREEIRQAAEELERENDGKDDR